MTKYEYHIQPVSLDGEGCADTSPCDLDFLGEQGWELVSVVGPTIAPPPHGLSMLHYFRREKQSAV